MTKRDSLIAAIRQNRKRARFSDACRAAEAIGFSLVRVSGSHHIYQKPGEPNALNFQNKNGEIPSYQVRQLLGMIDTYYEPDNHNSTTQAAKAGKADDDGGG